MTILITIGFLSVIFISCLSHARSCSFRERKSWAEYTATEKTTYLKALQYAMDGGYHIMFAEIYSEENSRQEAYETCGYLYWHRKFLLAYENMLRSLGDGVEFKCVTIPYWDFYEDFSKMQSGDCAANNMEDCSPILIDFGASSGQTDSVVMKGEQITGICSAGYPMNHFCESSTTSGNECKKRIPRGNWYSKSLPAELNIASLAELISVSNGFAQLSAGIEENVRFVMLNALGSLITSKFSPADPIFFSLYATIDMLQHAFYECRVGRAMSDIEKQTSNFAYQTCTPTSPNATSDITQIWDLPPAAAMPAHVHPTLATFFGNTAGKYFQFVDTYELMYYYKMDNFLASLIGNGLVCQQHTRRLTAISPRWGNSHKYLAPGEINEGNYAKLVSTRRKNFRRLKALGQKNTWGERRKLYVTNEYAQLVAVYRSRFKSKFTPRAASTKKALTRFDELYVQTKSFESKPGRILRQLKTIYCMNYHRKHGGVENYSATFCKFMLSMKPRFKCETSCSRLLRLHWSKLIKVSVVNWRDVFQN